MTTATLQFIDFATAFFTTFTSPIEPTECTYANDFEAAIDALWADLEADTLANTYTTDYLESGDWLLEE